MALAMALLVSAGSSSAFAYTQEQEQACTPDAMRLCGNYIPDVNRITACMMQKRSQLSPDCRRFFRRGAAAMPRKPVSKARSPKRTAKSAAP